MPVRQPQRAPVHHQGLRQPVRVVNASVERAVAFNAAGSKLGT